MYFIFPTNYNFKSKLFGVLDYSTAILNLVWDVFIFSLLNLIFTSLSIKIFLLVSLCFPILLFSVIGFNHESIIYVIYYLTKFYMNRCIYLYKK